MSFLKQGKEGDEQGGRGPPPGRRLRRHGQRHGRQEPCGWLLCSQVDNTGGYLLPI